jgi:hypothetical protein
MGKSSENYKFRQNLQHTEETANNSLTLCAVTGLQKDLKISNKRKEKPQEASEMI